MEQLLEMQVQLFSPIRSGSTLLFNFVRELVDPKVHIVKTHQYRADISCTVSIVRDPFNSVLSSCMRYNQPFTTYRLMQNVHEYLANGGNDVCDLPVHIPVHQYIELVYDPIKTLDRLQEYFVQCGIPLQSTICHKDIVEKYSLECVKQFISSYKTFDQYDAYTQFHGNHIGQFDGRTDYQSVLTPVQIRSMTPFLRSVCEKYSYPIMDPTFK
jgi:hypothetical protein